MQIPKWLIIVAWLIFFALIYWPIGKLILDAVNAEIVLVNIGNDASWLLQSQYYLLLNSLKLAAGTAALALVIGVPFAFILQRVKVRARELLSSIYIFPLLMPPYIHTVVWKDIFAPNSVLNHVLIELGIRNSPIEITNLIGAISVLALSYFPLITFLVESGLKNLDLGYEEIALAHSGRTSAALSVTLPMVAPQIFSGGVFVFIFSIIDFTVPDLLRVKVYPVEIFIEYSAMYNERAAALMALPLLLINFLLIAAVSRVMKNKSFVSFYRSKNSFILIKSDTLGSTSFVFCVLVVFLSVFMPIGYLLYMLEDIRDLYKACVVGYNSFKFSLVLAVVAAFLAVIVAFLLGYSLNKLTGRVRMVMDYLTQAPFAIPPILLGIALIKSWNQPDTDWLYDGPAILVIGCLAHLIPFAIRIVCSGFEQIPACLEEAGLLISDRWWHVQMFVVLPLLGASVLVAFFTVFIISLADLGVSLLVTPAGYETMPVLIYNYLHYGAVNLVAAFCLILLFAQYITWFGLARLYKRINFPG